MRVGVVTEFVERGDRIQRERSEAQSRLALHIRGVLDTIDVVKIFEVESPPFAAPPFRGVIDLHVDTARDMEAQAAAEYQSGFVERTQIGLTPQEPRPDAWPDFSPTLSDTVESGGPPPPVYMEHPITKGVEGFAERAASYRPPDKMGNRLLTLPEDIRGATINSDT